MRIVDLSVTVESCQPVDPEFQQARIQYVRHKETADQMAFFFGGVTPEDLPEGNGWAVDFMQICTHTGTHLDAPWHYYPTMNNGERAWTIDEVPLEWCIGPGVKLDMSHKPDGYKITRQDVIDYFAGKEYQIQPGDIILLQTNAQSRWGKAEYLNAGAGMSAEATKWLIDQGVKVMGTDGWSWDVPLSYEDQEFRETGNTDIIWEAHRVGRQKAYCHIEKLANLDKLPLNGYTVCCFPFKIKGASAGWTRTVAIFKED